MGIKHGEYKGSTSKFVKGEDNNFLIMDAKV